MNSLFKILGLDFISESWAIQLSLVLVAAGFIQLIARYFLYYAEKATGITDNVWDDALIKAVKSPLSLSIWILAVKLCCDILIKSFAIDGLDFDITTKIAVSLCFTWFLIRFINCAVTEYFSSGKIENSDFEHTTIDAFAKLAKICAFVFGGLVVVHLLGFSISGILAAGGAGGLVVGFAAKDLFANLFGSLTIYLDRPFNVGDWIRCDEKNIEGVVEYIGWRHTRLRALNKNPIYVPNAIFTTVVVENPSRMTHRRIRELIGIRYSDLDKIVAITNDVRAMLDEHSNLDHDLDKVVNFDKFSPSSVDFLVYGFTKSTNMREFCQIKQDILLKVAKIIEKHGAEIAFPTQTIHLEK